MDTYGTEQAKILLDGPGCSRWLDIQDPELELNEFYDKCDRHTPWNRWQRFKMWLFQKNPKALSFIQIYWD